MARPDSALGHPLGGEAAVLDLVEHLAHLGLHRRVDDPRTAGEVAVLGGVGDRVPHAGDALLVHEVDDQLQLVEALEVGRLGLVARLDERLEAGLHERGEAAAEHDLLAEEVGLGLLLEGGLEHAGAGAADGRRVGQREVAGLAGGVLRHGDEARHAAALGVGAAHEVAGALRGDEGDVDVRPAARPGRSAREKPWPTKRASPEDRLGAMCSLKIALCSVSGPRSMIRSASAVASATDSTRRPAASALATDDEPSRRPTRTSTPDSFRLSAWAWPCEP